MEVLGNRVFLDEEYTDQPSRSILPQNDGGCIIVTFFPLSNHKSQGKLIKMLREDFNPIPCSVKDVAQEKVKACAFPNPTHDELNIDISGLPQNAENRVRISDIHGITRMSRIIQGSANLLTIDVSLFESGVYFYSVYNKEKVFIKEKFVKE